MFLSIHSRLLKKRKNVNVLKTFITARATRLLDMQANQVEYEQIENDSFDYGFSAEEMPIVIVYKEWVRGRISYNFKVKGIREGEDITRLSINLNEYTQRRFGADLKKIECDEEAMYHRCMSEYIESKSGWCALI